jgi:glycosyltransferase involved in cell wall biosynthesis
MLISIIIPTYNRGYIIEEAIKSIINQTFQNWELIIVDDGSIDNTEELIKKYESKKIKYFKLSKNSGVNFARNFGIKKASGAWISLLDSDDSYKKNALSIIAEEIELIRKDYSVLGFQTTRVLNNKLLGNCGYDALNEWVYFSPNYEDVILKRGVTGDVHYCVKKEVFKCCYFSDWINGFEIMFFSKLAKYGIKFLYLNKAVVDVTVSDDSLSNKPFSRWPLPFARGYREFIKEHYRVLKKYPDLIRHYYLRIAKCYLIGGKYFLSFFWILRLIVKQPFGFLKYMVKRKKAHV